MGRPHQSQNPWAPPNRRFLIEVAEWVPIKLHAKPKSHTQIPLIFIQLQMPLSWFGYLKKDFLVFLASKMWNIGPPKPICVAGTPLITGTPLHR